VTYIGPASTYALVVRIGGHAWDPVVMTAIAGAESGWNTTAKSPTDDWGLFQINRYYHQALFKRYTWYNAGDNVVMAWDVWKSQHYRGWSTYTNGAYLRYLSQAQKASGGAEPSGGAVLGPSPIGPAPGPGTSDYSPTVRAVAGKGVAGAGRLHSTAHALDNLK
jgi:hypothetical protein